MMVGVQSIYAAKLAEIQNTLQANVSRCIGVSGAFADILSDVQARFGLTPDVSYDMQSTPYQTYSTPYSAYGTAVAPVYGQENVRVKYGSAQVNSIITQVAAEQNMDPNLIRAVVMTESSFRTDAVSRCGAEGLMQLMPGTAKELGVADSFDPLQNVRGGTAYLKKQIERFGDVRVALAAYNTGPGRVGRLNITDPNDPAEYNKISEGVRGYVDKVMKYYQQYRAQGV